MQTTKKVFVTLAVLSSVALVRSTYASDSQAPGQRDDYVNGKSGTSVVTEGFKLSLTTDKSEYADNTPINIRMTLKDVNHPRWTTEDAGHYTYFLDIRGSDGKSVGLTTFGKKYSKNDGMYEDAGLMLFTPGVEERVHLYRAQAFFNLSKPDVYTMQATRQVPSLADPKKMVTIYSNVVKITVGESKKAEKKAPVEETATEETTAE